MPRPEEMPKPGEVGPIKDMPAEQVVKAAAMIKQGRMISLAATRFTGMPLFPGHPPFQVLNAVSPRGIVADGRQHRIDPHAAQTILLGDQPWSQRVLSE